MNRRLAYFLSIVFIAFATNATAQLGIAPEAGFNLSGINENGSASANNIRLTGKVGAILDWQLDSNFFLQPGIFYSMQGQSIVDSVAAINYISVPVNVLYKIGRKNKDRFFIGLGGYAAYAVSDKLKSGKEHQNLSIGSSKQDDLMPFDFGANVRLGCELHSGLFIATQYSMGVVNIFPSNGLDEKNWVLSVTVGYILRKKPKKEIVIPTTF